MASGSFPFRAKSRKFAGIAPGGIETDLSSTAPGRKTARNQNPPGCRSA